MTESLTKLHEEIRNCNICKDILPPESKPLFQGNEKSKIVIVSQAPSRKANELRKKWSDNLSGKTLRGWFDVGDDIFYNEDMFYLTALGKCYPGKGKGGDKVPPPMCAETWLKKELMMLKPKLIVTVGSKCFKWFFPEKNYDDSLQGKTMHWNNINVFPLPHPSGANAKWKSQNKTRLEYIIKQLRKHTNEVVKNV